MRLIVIIIGLISLDYSNGSSIDRELPCHFLDSINITDGALQSDNSIIFRDTKFVENQYARINYILDNGTNPIPVEPYLRGCLCNIRSCIRLCCPYGTIYERLPNGGKTCRKHELATKFESEIHTEDQNVKTLLEKHHFGYVEDRPCPRFYVGENYTMTHVMKPFELLKLQKKNKRNLNTICPLLNSFSFFRREMYYSKIKRCHIGTIA